MSVGGGREGERERDRLCVRVCVGVVYPVCVSEREKQREWEFNYK